MFIMFINTHLFFCECLHLDVNMANSDIFNYCVDCIYVYLL